MNGPKALVWALAAAGVAILLWFARGILTSELPRGAGVAAWLLWLIAAAALLTLVAYLRELAVHHHAVRGGGSWRPVPALLVLWAGGLTALVSLPVVLPGEKAAAATESATAHVTSPTSTPAMTATTSAVKVSRSTTRTAPASPQPRVAAPTRPTSPPASVPQASSTSVRPATSTSASTTTKKPKPKPTRSTGVPTPPGITLTLP